MVEDQKNPKNNDKMKDIENNMHIDIVLFNERFVGTSYMEVIKFFFTSRYNFRLMYDLLV